MKACTFITAGALFACLSGPGWAIGCAIEPSPINCSWQSMSVQPSLPVYQPYQPTIYAYPAPSPYPLPIPRPSQSDIDATQTQHLLGGALRGN
jgi:hypothetical protein